MILYTKINNSAIKLADLAFPSDASISWKQANEFLRIITGEEKRLLSSHLARMCETLDCEESLWPILISRQSRDTIVDSKKQELNSAISKNLKYFESWSKNRTFLDSLCPFRVDTKKIKDIACEKTGSFSLRWEDKRKIVYSTSRTATGRLTITAGMNFLVMPKETRKCILADFSDSTIYSIDFTSLEPRVALWAASESTSREDVYEEIMEMCGIEKRSVAKLATLSALYGAGIHRLAKTTGSQRQAKQIIERVSHYFDVSGFEERLEKSATENGVVKNYFGRPLYEATKNKRLRLNHFIQSTAAEMAVSMFADLCEKFPKTRPLLVIHDALIVEVPKSEEADFLSACKNMQHEGFWFPTKAEILDI